MKAKQIFGQKFNRLTALMPVGRKAGRVLWLVRCDCGTDLIVKVAPLTTGQTKSCGCLGLEKAIKQMTGNKFSYKHGHNISSLGFRSPTYYSWSSMIQRCQYVKHPKYANYGGRGIVIYERWLGKHGFEHFLEDMGERPNGKTLDRIDTNGNYEPSNCRWSTLSEQNRNRWNSSKSENYDEHSKWKLKLINRLNIYIFDGINSKLFFDSFGIDLLGFREYIESQFKEGMTWNNHGKHKIDCKIWQFDHIIPINKFDLSKEEDRKKCFHYTNLRPMWWEDNMARCVVNNRI